MTRLLPALVLLAACGDAGPETRVQIAVAPLEGPVRDVEYTITIVNAAGETTNVIDRLISSAFGYRNGGLAYIAPCDAGANRVLLSIDRVWSGSSVLEAHAFANPAPPESPIEQVVTCVANADVDVAFELVVALPAEQGFFDIAVSFEDVFCSAKLDCVDDLGGDLALLIDPTTGERAPTAVMALACGVPGQLGDAAPTLHVDDLVVTCADGTVTIDPTLTEGNTNLSGAGVYQVSLHRQEDVRAGWLGCSWSAAIGLALGPDARDCNLSWRATVTENGSMPPAPARYPEIVVNTPLTDADGARVCTRHPLGSDEVAVDYVTEPAFAHVWTCGEQLEAHNVACDGRFGGDRVRFVQAGANVDVHYGVDASAHGFELPAGATVLGCCADACCSD